jgi:hypothetical protein
MRVLLQQLSIFGKCILELVNFDIPSCAEQRLLSEVRFSSYNFQLGVFACSSVLCETGYLIEDAAMVF